MEPRIQFCTTPAGVSIAFATLGEGPALVVRTGWTIYLELDLADRLKGAHILRGFEDPTRLWELAWRSSGAGTAALAPDGLTPREVEVLRLIAAGRSTREIADALVISIGTVERYVTNLYGKIGARGRADATAYAFRHQLATLDVP